MAYTLFSKTNVSGKNVIVRADLNLPISQGVILDDERIHSLKPTIEKLVEYGAKQIKIISHFGRPIPSTNPADWDRSQSLKKILLQLEKVLNQGEIIFNPDCLSDSPEGKIILCENIRCYPGEEKNDRDFARSLANNSDVYINEAFSCSHRAHASIDAITKFLPSFMGVSFSKEIAALEKTLTTPQKPVTALVGGSKVSTKLTLLSNLIKNVDNLIIGGAMANTFLKAQGFDVGKSLVEDDLILHAQMILKQSEAKNCKIYLPVDVKFGSGLTDKYPETRRIENLVGDGSALDFGPKTIDTVCQVLRESKTFIWNGPVGAYEYPPYDAASKTIASCAAQLCRSGNLSAIAGGGDTVAILKMADCFNDLTYVSTAGGAFLEWLEGKALPGVVALKNTP
jgi:phosphoglycerate kinase